MFRPWQYDPQPDFSWNGLNNFASNRVNINHFNSYPRGSGGGGGIGGLGGLDPSLFNLGSRPFDFARLFNLADINNNNAFGPPLRNDGRLRNRVTVILPDGSRVLVDRDVMHEHLPRTRNAMPPGGGAAAYFAVPEFLHGYQHGLRVETDQAHFHSAFSQATAFIFRYLEALSRSNSFPFFGRGGGGIGVGGGGVGVGGAASFDMFARPRFILANARDRARTVHEIFLHLFFLCCALDQDRALGCSEALARPIAEFLVEFMPQVEAFLPPGAAQFLFVGYSRIFRETRFEMDVLRDLWELMDAADQAWLRSMIHPQLAANGLGSNAQRIWTALRQMGLV